MKNNMGVWIDGSKAVIVNLTANSVKEIGAEIDNKVYHMNEGDKGTFTGGGHHINNERKFEERKKHHTHDYLQLVINEIKDADSIFVFGPAEMKTHLKTTLEADKHLAPKLSAVESADKLSNNQIFAAVKNHFTIKKS